MKLWPCEVSPRDRANIRIRHRAFYGEAIQSHEKLYSKNPQYSVKNQVYVDMPLLQIIPKNINEFLEDKLSESIRLGTVQIIQPGSAWY